MIKTIIYDEDCVVGINPTKITLVELIPSGDDDDDKSLVIQFGAEDVDDYVIPHVDFALAHDIIDFLNNPEEMIFTVE